MAKKRSAAQRRVSPPWAGLQWTPQDAQRVLEAWRRSGPVSRTGAGAKASSTSACGAGGAGGQCSRLRPRRRRSFRCACLGRN